MTRGLRLAFAVAALALPCFAMAAAPPGTVPSHGYENTDRWVESGNKDTKPIPIGGTAQDYAFPILQLRTYYLDGRNVQNVQDAQNVAWALGGWAGMTARFRDLFEVGVVGYTSQPLYAPDGKGGTRLLQPNQDAINALGEAYGAVNLSGNWLVGYRQFVSRPLVNENDTRMVPNIFEGYTLRGGPRASGDKEKAWSYAVGYLTKVKVRDSESYTWMSQQAGAPDVQKGMIFGGVTVPFRETGFVRADEQYVIDTFNTFYVDGLVPFQVDEATLSLAAQYFAQQSVGSKQIGDFSTWALGVEGVAQWKGITAWLAYTQVGKGRDTLIPYGENPSYLNLQQRAFNTAGEKAGLAAARYDFPDGDLKGLSGRALYAQGRDRINSTTGATLPNQRETDLRLDYSIPTGMLKGLVATLRYSWLRQDGAPTATQLRAYVKYEVAFP